MPQARPAATTADDIADNIRSLIDRVVDAKFTHEMAKRGQDIANAIADRGAEVGDRAGEAWRDSRPARRNAAKRLSRASSDAAKWSDDTWRRSLRPALRDLWKRRTLALGAAGAAVPASRELVDVTAARIGLKEREERHWGAFFLGLLLGAVAGAIAAMLTTPKRGSEMRQELATRVDEVTTRAKDTEWVPIFQRETNGHAGRAGASMAEAGGNLQEAAAEAGAASGETADQAADETAEAINEAYDSVDRESSA
jgi:gas vesicle protein